MYLVRWVRPKRQRYSWIAARTSNGRLACPGLYIAIRNGHVDVATLLLDRGADYQGLTRTVGLRSM